MSNYAARLAVIGARGPLLDKYVLRANEIAGLGPISETWPSVRPVPSRCPAPGGAERRA
ncbi:MAG: hypothetical protein U0414_04995 [Polyangiaceae bacterium]